MGVLATNHKKQENIANYVLDQLVNKISSLHNAWNQFKIKTQLKILLKTTKNSV